MSNIRDKHYLSFVHRLGQCSCAMSHPHECDGWLEVHHSTETGRGKSQMAGDGEAFLLCQRHHKGEAPFGVHGGKKTWAAKYGAQEIHIQRTRDLVRVRFGYEPPPRDPPPEEIAAPTFRTGRGNE